MTKRILVPLDGSSISEAVLPFACDIARGLGAEVTFIQVVNLAPATVTIQPAAGAMVDPAIITEQLEAEVSAAKEYLETLCQRWSAEGVATRWEVLRGVAAAAIIEYAEVNNFDLIAMSTHGRSGLGRLVFGSVADEVIRNSGKPVLIVKPQGHTGG